MAECIRYTLKKYRPKGIVRSNSPGVLIIIRVINRKLPIQQLTNESKNQNEVSHHFSCGCRRGLCLCGFHSHDLYARSHYRWLYSLFRFDGNVACDCAWLSIEEQVKTYMNSVSIQTIELSETNMKEALSVWLRGKFPITDNENEFVVSINIKIETNRYGLNEFDKPVLSITATRKL